MQKTIKYIALFLLSTQLQLIKGQSPSMQIACNIADLECVDLVKANPEWMHGNGRINENYQFTDWGGNLLNTEPKTMRLTDDGSFYPHHSPIIMSNGTKIYPQLWFNLTANGTYTVISEGKGKLTFAYSQPEHFSSAANEYSFTNGTTFTFTTTGLTNPDNSGFPSTTGSGPGGDGGTIVWLQITESDSINPIKNIRVLPPDYTDSTGVVHHFADEYLTKPFHPKLIEDMQKYTVIRFMDIARTNGSKVKYWSQLKQPNELGAKPTNYIDMINLGNQANRDIWLTIPHLASNGFIDTLAQLVKANLKPSLKAYIEYSNEVWNTGFSQTGWASEQGMLMGWTDFPGGKFYVRRSGEVFKRFADIYAEDRNRILFVCAWQMGSGNSLLGDYYNDPLVNQKGVKPDLFAVAPYFYELYQQGDIGVQGECNWQTCADCVATNVPSVSKILDDMSNSIKTDVTNGLKAAKLASVKYNIPLITYEGGPHAIGLFGAENCCELTDNLMKANRDPRMYEIYTEWVDTLQSAGVQLLNQYFDCGGWSKWGAWGLEEFRGQDLASQKFRALVDWQKANPAILDHLAPTKPGTPIKESATASSITLSWSPSTDNGSIIGYDLFLDDHFIGSSNCQITNTKFTVNGLKPSTLYNFYVKARDFAGNYSAQSNTVSVSTLAPDTQKPTAPINLQLIQKTYNKIKIKWSPSSDNDRVEKYLIKWDTSVDSTSEVSYLLQDLTPSTTYKIVLLAKDPSGNISDSSYITIKTAELPTLKAHQTKSNITVDGHLNEKSWILPNIIKNTVSLASTLDDDTISIGILWDNNYLYIGAKAIDPKLIKSVYHWDGDGFEILIDGNNNRSKTFESGFDVKYTFQWNNSSMVGTDTIGVLHKYQNISGGWSCEVAIPWSKLGISAPQEGLNAGFDIIYDDADYNEWGRNRQYSIIGDESIYNSCEQFTSLTLISDTIAPSTPTNIIFTDITMSSTIISWSGSSDLSGIKGYNVFVNKKQVNSDLVNSTTYFINNLQPNTEYQVSISAIDNNHNTSEKATNSIRTASGNALINFNAELNTTVNYPIKYTTQQGTLNRTIPFSTATNSELFGKIAEFDKQFEIKGGFKYEYSVDPPSNGNLPGIYHTGSSSSAGSLYIFTGESSASNFTGVLMWTKEKFLNGNNLFANIAFDSTADSRLMMKIKASQFGKMRFVVKTTSNYYISESIFYSSNDPSGTNTFELSEFGNNGNTNKRWALYDPTTLTIPEENALNFVPTDLNNIQEVGFAFSVGRPQWAYSFGLVEFEAYGVQKITDTESPSTPLALKATNITNSAFTLNWSASTDNQAVKGYNIFSVDPNTGVNTLISSTSSLNYIVGGLTTNETYEYRVQAYDRNGNKSDLSTPLKVKISNNTSINTNSEYPISLFPNPTNDNLIIEGAPISSKVTIYNINGDLALKSIITNSREIIHVKELHAGIYIIEINNGNCVYRDKFIKY